MERRYGMERINLPDRSEALSKEELREIENECFGSGVVTKDWAWCQDCLGRLVADLKDTREERNFYLAKLDYIGKSICKDLGIDPWNPSSQAPESKDT